MWRAVAAVHGDSKPSGAAEDGGVASAAILTPPIPRHTPLSGISVLLSSLSHTFRVGPPGRPPVRQCFFLQTVILLSDRDSSVRVSSLFYTFCVRPPVRQSFRPLAPHDSSSRRPLQFSSNSGSQLPLQLSDTAAITAVFSFEDS